MTILAPLEKRSIELLPKYTRRHAPTQYLRLARLAAHADARGVTASSPFAKQALCRRIHRNFRATAQYGQRMIAQLFQSPLNGQNGGISVLAVVDRVNTDPNARFLTRAEQQAKSGLQWSRLEWRAPAETEDVSRWRSRTEELIAQEARRARAHNLHHIPKGAERTHPTSVRNQLISHRQLAQRITCQSHRLLKSRRHARHAARSL